MFEYSAAIASAICAMTAFWIGFVWARHLYKVNPDKLAKDLTNALLESAVMPSLVDPKK